jgi:hypothetical protein
MDEECRHYIEFYAVDDLGNVELVQNQTFFVDDTPPVIANVVDSPDPQTPGGFVNISCDVVDSHAVNSVRVIIVYPDGSSVNVTMSVSGVNGYYYRASFSQLGWYYYSFWAVDNSGNGVVSSVFHFRVRVPARPPTPPHLPDRDRYEFLYFLGPHEWNDTYWVITNETWVCFDLELLVYARIVELYYQIDREPWTRYTECFNLTLGTHHLYYYGVDTHGYHSNIVHIIIDVVDSLAPTTTCTFSPTMPDRSSGWYTNTITITLTATDDISGVDTTYYKLDNDNSMEYTGSITITEDGEHIFTYYSFDKAGIKELEKSTIFRIDTTRPAIGFEQPTYGHLYLWGKEILPLKRTMIIGETTISTMAHDESSGIDRVEFYVDDELKHTVSDEPFEWLWDERILGRHTLKAVAYDNAGNIAIVEQEVWIFNL